MPNLLDELDKRYEQKYNNGGLLSKLDAAAAEAGINDEPPTQADEGIVSNFIKGLTANAAGSAGGIAGWFGGENAFTKSMDDVVRANQRSHEYASDDFSWNYLTNGSGAAYDTGMMAGSILTTLPFMFIPGLGWLGGAASKFVPGLLRSGLARSAAGAVGADVARAKAAQWAASKAGEKAIGGVVRYGAGSGAGESGIESGQGVTEAFQQGKENPYAVGAEIFAKNLPWLVASNIAEGAILAKGFSRFGGKPGESLKKRAALAIPRTAPYAAVQGIQQPVEEIGQERIKEEAFGQPTGGYLPWTLTENEARAAHDTFIPGLLLGGLGGVRGSMRAKAPEPQAVNDPLHNASLAQARAALNAQRTQNSAVNVNGLGNAPIQIAQAEPSAQPAMSVEEAQTIINQSAPANNRTVDISMIPMQDIEDEGLAHTNNALKSKLGQLYAWAKDNLGQGFVISGGWRSPEHNKRVNGSSTSHHLHGNAVDVDVSMYSEADKERLLAKAREMGFNNFGNGDNMYHDRGSGLHAHLTYEDDGTGGNQQQSSNGGFSNDRFIRIAQKTAALIRQKYPDASPNLEKYLYGQMAHETGHFTHDKALEYNNFAGLHGGAEGRHYANDDEYIKDYASFFTDGYHTNAIYADSGMDFARRLSNKLDGGSGWYTDRNYQAYGNTIEEAVKEFDEKAAAAGYSSDNVGSNSSANINVEIPQSKQEDNTNQPLQDAIDENMKLANAQNDVSFDQQEEKTDKELITEAKQAAQDAGDMDELQRIIKAERSGNQSELAKITEKAREAKAKEAKGKSAPPAPKINTVNKNLAGIVHKLVHQAKNEGIQIEDELVNNVIASGDEAQLKNYVGMLQNLIKFNGYEARVAKGKDLLNYADEHRIDIPPAVRQYAFKGYQKAIDQVQAIIGRANNGQQEVPAPQPIVNAEQRPTEQTATPMQTELPVNMKQEAPQVPPQVTPQVAQAENPPQSVQAESAQNQEALAKAEPAPKAETEPAKSYKDTEYPKMYESEYKRYQDIAKVSNQSMMELHGQSTLEDMQKEGLAVDEQLEKDLKAGNVEAIAYASAMLFEHSMKGTSATSNSNYTPKESADFSVKRYDNLKQLSIDITEDKAKIHNWPHRAIRKANELGFTLSEDEKAIISPEGKRYDLPGTAIEEFRLNQRNAEDEKAASAKAENQQENTENVDKSGDKSANDERKDLIDRVMQGYHDGKKSLDDAKVELKHYRDRFANMARGKVTPTEGRSLNEIVKYADQQLKELESASKKKSDNELSQQENNGKIEVEEKPAKKGPTIVRTRTRLHFDNDGIHTDVISQEEVEPMGEPKTEKQEKSTDFVSDRFGSEQEAAERLLESFGKSKKKFVNVVDDSDEALQNALAEFDKEFNKLSANPVFNPNLLMAAFKVGAIYLQRGTNKFAAWAQEMTNTRKELKPFLPAVWSALKEFPADTKLDEKQMTNMLAYVGTQYDKGVSKADIKKNVANLLGEGYDVLVDSAYAGVEKYPSVEELRAIQEVDENAEGRESGKSDSRRTGDEGERSERSETVSPGTEQGRESVSERTGTDQGTDRRLEETSAQNGEAVSENGNPEGVRAGVSGETGRQAGKADELSHDDNGRAGGSESVSDAVGRGGRQSGGTGSQGSSRVGGVREETSSPLTNAENYHIDDMNALFGGTPKVRFTRNKKAIEVFQDLQATKRVPTQEDKDAMAAYTGWGSFGQQLFQGTYENPKPAKGWEEESEWLRETLGKEDWESAKDSIINAHYTAPPVVKAMWDMIRKMGFKGGRVLEPSMGVGNFFGLMPKDLEASSALFGVEMDTTTGGMAKMLYPEANIQITPYQDYHVADGTFDLIVGNVPFGDIAPADRRYDKFRANLHDYFFLKGIDELRSGGVMIAITSKGTMDKMNRSVRMELAKKAELVDAYRFPTGAFGEYAGTDVVTDVLVFKKREQPIMDVSGEDWVNTTEHKSDQYDYNRGDYYTYRVNNFFENHPEKVLGKMGFGRSTGKQPGLMVTMDSENFQKQLDGLEKSIAKGVYEEAHYDKNLQYVSNNEKDRLGTLQEVDGKLYVATGVDSKPIEAFKEWQLGTNITSTATINARLEELKDLVKLRKAYAKLEDAEKKDSPDVEKIRKQLKAVYDAHVAKYCLDKNGNPVMVTYTEKDENNKNVKKKRPKILEDTAGLKLFKKASEPNYYSLCALQRKDGKPAKILTERVMRTSKKDIDNPTVQEALMIQRNKSMHIDVAEIAKMAKKSEAEVLKELEGFLFKTPNGDYQVKDQYLSGNVRRKLREAKAAYANGDKSMQQNIDFLEKVIPEDIPYYNITVSFGGTWIDIPYYKQFIANLVGVKGTDKIDITRNTNGAWSVKFNDKSLNNTAGATMTYGTSDVKFDRLLTHALNHTKPTITRRDPEGNTYKDEEAMKKAVDQIEKIRETFADWLWQDEKRKVALAHNYNEIMNNTAKPSYDGSFLDMVGMMLKRGDKEFNLRQHQINAIYRGLVNGSGIYAHEVGTGKTHTMGGLAMESRRFGIAKKPLILAHNANSAIVSKEIQEMYPGAKVLYISGDGKNVKKDLMRVKMDDWDVVVMPHSKTNMLTLKTETLDALASDLIAELEDDAMEAAKEDGIDLSKIDLDNEKEVNKIRSQTAKDLVRQRLRIKEQIRKYAYKSSDKEAIPFEDLGVDMIIVDESHDYKKPPFTTKMSVKGLQKSTSGQSIQLSFLTQYVQGLNNGKGVHLFTGTPITNTITEMYHNMKYVMPNEMKEAGVYNFDDWFNAFASVNSSMEYTSTGEVDNVDRLNAFVNVAELRRMVGQYMDIVFAEDMPEFKPRETASGKTLADNDLTEGERDYLLNGRDENAVGRPYMMTVNEVIPMNDAQKSILSMFMGYAKDWKQASKKMRKQIMMENGPQSPLYTESSTHKAAMDARMFNPNINVSGMDSKEARVIKNVMDIYHQDKRTTQVIMMDQGKSDSSLQIPRDEKGYPIGGKNEEGKSLKVEVPTYNLQKGIINGLIEQGIPEKEIAVVTGTTNPDKKAKIAAAVDRGEIRVVIGSTATLGTGVNMQTNLKAIHHVDAPWMPGELDQRNGRILRQGNKWNTVIEYRYITEKMDGRRWQVLSTKKKFIKMFMKADDNLRVLDGDAVDVSEEGGSGNDFEETLSKATGDPRFLRKANLEETVKKLEKSHAAFVAGIEDAKYRLQKLKEGGLDELKDNVRTLTAIQDKYGKYKQTHADSFEITIGGKTYTKTADANEAIAAAFRNSDKIDKEFKLGEFAGLNLYGYKQRNIGFSGSYTNRIRITDGDKTIPGFDCADSTGGINQKLANIGKAIDREQNKLDMAESDIKTLEKQIKGTFPREAVLKAKQKELKVLEQDLIDNPVPPPQWLVEGAPMQADVLVNGKRGTVESYRVVGETSFSTDEEGKTKKDTSYDEGKLSFYVGVRLDGSDKIELYPWQDVKDTQGLPMITAPEGVSESEELKDNEVRPAETKETKAEEPAKEEKTETPKEKAKFSMTGEMKRALANAKVINESNYTSQERKVAEFGKTIGTPIVWIEAAPKMHGFHVFTDMVIDGKVIPAGSTVLNRRSNMPLSQVFWHETFHWIANNEDNKNFYDEVMDYFKGKISKAQMDAFVKRNGRTDLTTDEDIIEEMLADAFEDVSQRVEIFKEMGAEQPSLARRFVAWVKRIMDKFAEFFHNPEGKLTTAQRDSFVKAFGRLARDMKDGKGQPLFKVYKEGKEIKLPSGQLVTEGLKLSAENDIDNHLRTGHNRLKKKHEGWVTNRVKFDEGYPKVSLLFDYDVNEDSNTTLERRKQELYFIDGRWGDDYKTALINILGERKNEVDHRISISSANEAIDVYRNRFREIIEMPVGMNDEEEGNIIAALALIQGGIEYAKTNPGYNAERDVRFSFGQREDQRNAGGNSSRGRSLQSDNGRYGLERTDNQRKVTTKHSDSQGAFSSSETKYSYGPSDNSNESLFHRIKNIMAGKGSEDSEKFRYRKHLTEMIEKALDVKLRYGKMDGNKSQVIYKPDDRVLRSRHAFDWENILPVAGRVAAEKLEIEPTEEMNNYIADWILTGAPNNVSREADTFHKAMQQHPADSAKLEDLRDAFAEWLGKDYREQMQGTIQWKNKEKTGAWRLWRKDKREALYEEFVEELEPINRMVKQVNANLTEKGQSKLDITANPMVAFRMLRGSYGRAMAALEGRNDGAVDALRHAFPNVDFTGFKTLYQILKEIDAFQNAEKQRDFVTYCTACHILDMHQHNNDIRQEQQHLKNKIEQAKGKPGAEKRIKELETNIEALDNEIMPIPAAYSKENCEKYIEDGFDKYHEAQQDLVHFSNTTAAILADSGVISEKRFRELLNKWQNYVPLFRVFEENEDVNFGDSMKHIKGSMRDIVNPLESIIRNTAQFIQKSEMNKAKCLLADVARCDASGWLIEEVDKSDADKTVITFWENGKRKYLQTDPDIVRAVNNMGADSSHFFIKFLHAITRLARACFTMASPEFALRNVARDWGDASLYTKYGMWVNPLDIVKGFIHAWRRDGVYYEWLTQGAAQASALSLDRDYTQSTLDKLGRGFWKRMASRDWYNALLEGLQMAGEYSEYGTRIAMYQKTKNAILKDKPNATAEEINAAMLEAAFESRDLMDFARHGKAGAEYNKITAFANASIQGWDKLYRSLNFKEDPKRATRTAAKLMLYGAMPAMILFLMYKDEDWYREAPEWLKSTHWLLKIGDREIRIPKAADMGNKTVTKNLNKSV